MDENPGVHNGYLMKHQRGGGNFCWSGHAFRIHADVENGEFRLNVSNGSIQVGSKLFFTSVLQ
jgi:hypothetical protein